MPVLECCGFLSFFSGPIFDHRAPSKPRSRYGRSGSQSERPVDTETQYQKDDVSRRTLTGFPGEPSKNFRPIPLAVSMFSDIFKHKEKEQVPNTGTPAAPKAALRRDTIRRAIEGDARVSIADQKSSSPVTSHLRHPITECASWMVVILSRDQFRNKGRGVE